MAENATFSLRKASGAFIFRCLKELEGKGATHSLANAHQKGYHARNLAYTAGLERETPYPSGGRGCELAPSLVGRAASRTAGEGGLPPLGNSPPLPITACEVRLLPGSSPRPPAVPS